MHGYRNAENAGNQAEKAGYHMKKAAGPFLLYCKNDPAALYAQEHVRHYAEAARAPRGEQGKELPARCAKT